MTSQNDTQCNGTRCMGSDAWDQMHSCAADVEAYRERDARRRALGGAHAVLQAALVEGVRRELRQRRVHAVLHLRCEQGQVLAIR